MNKEQENAVRQVIGNLQDDLARYRMSEMWKPNQVTGNGVSFVDVIEELERLIAELKDGLEERGDE